MGLKMEKYYCNTRQQAPKNENLIYYVWKQLPINANFKDITCWQF